MKAIWGSISMSVLIVRVPATYISPSGSGLNEAFQSMGIWGTICAWKLYPESQGYAIFPRERWIALRLKVLPKQARLYVNNMSYPTLIFRDMPFESGGVQFWSFCGSGYFRNFCVAELGSDPIEDKRISPWRLYARDELLCDWEVSPVLDISIDEIGRLPDDIYSPTSTWLAVTADARGIVNLSPLPLRFPHVNAVFARASVVAERDGPRRCWFTYTDRMKIWCNGRLVFKGVPRGWQDPGREKFFGGRLIPDEFEIKLPLRKGNNELLVMSGRTENWGWGYWFRLARE
jgi:hypothetical protein